MSKIKRLNGSDENGGLADVTGLILAGGEGRRAGGVDKGLIEWRGKRLVEHVYERLLPQVGELIISCNRNHDVYGSLAPTVTDKRAPSHGPLAGIEAVRDKISTPFLAICPCDTPSIPPDLVIRLLDGMRSASDACGVAYAHDQDRAHYLCAVLRTDRLPTCTNLLEEGRRSVHGWYATLQPTVVRFLESTGAFENHNHLA